MPSSSKLDGTPMMIAQFKCLRTPRLRNFLRKYSHRDLAQRPTDVINVRCDFAALSGARSINRRWGPKEWSGNLYYGNLLKQWNFLIFCTNMDSQGCVRNRICADVRQHRVGVICTGKARRMKFLKPSALAAQFFET